MKISKVIVDIIERDTGSLKVKDERSDIGGKTTQGVLRIITDEGYEGNAFIGDQASDSSDRIKIIVEKIAPKIIGMPFDNRESLWSSIDDLSGHGLPIFSSWAPVDVALWDIAGKYFNKPIYKLLGGNDKEIPLYATFPPRHKTFDGFVNEAEELLNEGYSAYKIHPGDLSVNETIITIEKIRELVGDKMTLMLDRNHGYSLAEAMKVGQALDTNNFYWYEDPVETSNIRAIKTLKENIVTPINMSDSAGFLIKEAANYISQDLIGMVRGTTRKLGITGLIKQCAIADAFGINCEIGLAGNSLMNVANLHVISSVNNNTFYEYWRPEHIHQWGVKNEISINKNGKLNIPSGPGLGISLDEDWIQFHKVETLE
ncbi:MAG: hypothetical protein FI730_02235 [SAR202 cluster bacterium]|nr:hypothetical protein [SAR202 cluster bacterium]MQF93258.1 hypothetical protein [SAR202 cluster bacterium]|tara:strand:+ start:950 stop:2065 length:1116 start_codon:yes stop_codon:yes gene_type:complete